MFFINYKNFILLYKKIAVIKKYLQLLIKLLRF